MNNLWYTYMVRCNDNSLYTGVTTDLQRRVNEHNGKIKGAKYTKNKQPVTLVYYQTQINRSAACQYEYKLKQLPKKYKEQLVTNFKVKIITNLEDIKGENSD